ncbi:hypothetical protein NQT62_09375 [Limnobacter humi]|uniref:Metallo-beta-lactamase domain-containing protein n=1 Tax=Limnobacter humi TaxID=1778671 RepID=A0ABT1WGJ3_9BURK|nr:hypothetical protein [Limnobacter humi]MCQ8896641.1 hypothetical protein [Limnobacter humi]
MGWVLVLTGCVWASQAQAVSPAPTEQTCWTQHRATIYEYTCAGKYLPAEGQDYALSLWVLAGTDSTVVIDTGPTAEVGQAAAQAILDKFGRKPLWLVNTQPKPEHVLGNLGFRQALGNPPEFGKQVVAAKKTAELMQARCGKCIENLGARLGNQVMSKTQPVVPQKLLIKNKGTLWTLGKEWGAWEYSTEDNLESEQALMLSNPGLNAMWVGSAVQPRSAPDLFDGMVGDRIDYLAKLQAQMKPDTLLMSSFGALDHAWVERNLDYFRSLQTRILFELDLGTNEVDLIDELGKPPARVEPASTRITAQGNVDLNPSWTARDIENHQLNIQRIIRQTEGLLF